MSARFELTGAMTEAFRTRRPGGEDRSVPPLARDPERASRREFQRRVTRAALTVDAIVVLTLLTAIVAWKLRTVILLVAISLFMTLLLHPLVSFLERRDMRRSIATAVVFVVGIGVASTLALVILTPLVHSAEHLSNELPVIIRQAQHGKGTIGKWATKFHLLKYVTAKNGGAQSLITKLGKPAISIGKGVLSGVFSVVTIFFLTFFLLIHAPRIYRAILEWMQPERAARVRVVVSDVERSVVGYIAGDFATSLIAGTVIWLTLLITGVPYPLVIGIWVAIVDFLPLVGGLLAGVPTVILATLHSVPAGIATLIVFLVYQGIENHLLYPIIMSRTVRLNSLWVLISILIGAELGDFVGSVFGGFVGALLAVPAGSAVQVVARDLWHHRTDTAEPPTDVARPPRRAIPADAPEGSAGASGTAAGAE